MPMDALCKNSPVLSKKERKKFDKKKYINLKLNNKLKVQQWEEKRRKNFQRKYNKHSNTNKSQRSKEILNNVEDSKEYRSLGVIQAAQLELKRRKEEKKQRGIEKLKKRKEIEHAIVKYKEKKAEKFKKISKKTKYGQPVMKERIQLLFEEIKQKISTEKT